MKLELEKQKERGFDTVLCVDVLLLRLWIITLPKNRMREPHLAFDTKLGV